MERGTNYLIFDDGDSALTFQPGIKPGSIEICIDGEGSLSIYHDLKREEVEALRDYLTTRLNNIP